MKQFFLSTFAILVIACMLISCNNQNQSKETDFFSSDLQMEMVRGNAEQVKVYEFVPKKKNVGLKLISDKRYDEQGLLLPKGDFEELRDLKEAARYTGNSTVSLDRNENNQLVTMMLEPDDGWDRFEYTYDSLGTGYLIYRNATYFEAIGSLNYKYDENHNLIGETSTLSNHYEGAIYERVFSNIGYDQYGNWVFRRVDESMVVTDEVTGREKHSSKTYYEMREIYYRPNIDE